MQRATVVLAVALLVACGGCATQPVARHTAADEALETRNLAQLISDQRAADRRTQRWLQRKTMCRTLDVRFDRSGLCW